MQAWQFFLVLSAVYLSHEMHAGARAVLGIVFAVAGVLAMWLK